MVAMEVSQYKLIADTSIIVEYQSKPKLRLSSEMLMKNVFNVIFVCMYAIIKWFYNLICLGCSIFQIKLDSRFSCLASVNILDEWVELT